MNEYKDFVCDFDSTQLDQGKWNTPKLKDVRWTLNGQNKWINLIYKKAAYSFTSKHWI